MLRFVARRRIPFRACLLKEYVSGIDGCIKTCDKEEARSTLGEAETLTIEDSPRECGMLNVVLIVGQHVT